jgi:hypothetical protein
MNIDHNKLIQLKARALALDKQIAEQKEMLERGILDPGRYAALSTDYNRQHNEILLTLKDAVAGADARIDNVLSGAIDGTAEPEEMSQQLKEVAEERGLGVRLVDAIAKNRGTIITWVIDIALAIGKHVV